MGSEMCIRDRSIALLGTRLTIVYIVARRCRSLMLILLASGCISSLVSHTIELAALIKRARCMPLLLSTRRGFLLVMLNQTAICNVFALLNHLRCRSYDTLIGLVQTLLRFGHNLDILSVTRGCRVVRALVMDDSPGRR